MTLVCGLEVSYNKDGSSVAWTVPVSCADIPRTQEQIQTFIKELDIVEKEHIIHDCFLICDRNLNMMYKRDDVTSEDIAAAFDVIENSDVEISEVD